MAGIPVQVSFDSATQNAINSLPSIAKSLAIIAASAGAGPYAKSFAGIETALARLAEIASAIETTPPPYETALDGIESLLARLIKDIEVQPASQLVIGTPFAVKGHLTMSDAITIANDAIVAWPILDENNSNVIVPGPVGDSYTVVASNPAAFNAVVGVATPPGGAEIPCVLTNALVALSDDTNGGGGLSFTLSDSAGLKSATSPTFSIGADMVASQLAIGTLFESGTQAVPTAPGP